MNKNKKLLGWVVVIIAIILIVIVATNGSNKVSDTNSEIKIGSILILSGEGATWGESAKNGIDMAVEEVNNNGGVNGKKLVVTHEDNASEPAKAVSAFQKLTNSDKVKFIIGPNWSNSGVPLIDLAMQNKVVIISPSLGVKEFNEANKYLFNTWPHDFLLSRKLADYVFEKGHRNVAVFGANEVWVKDQTKNFVERFKELGGKIAFTYEPLTTETDVRTQVLKVKNDKSIDAIVMTTDGYSLTHVVAKQLKQMSVGLPMFSITIDSKILSDCGIACDNMIMLSFLTPTKNFRDQYVKKFNRQVEIGADSAYDAVMMLAKAIEETNEEDVDSVAKYIASITEYNGASGKLTSDGKRAFTKPYIVQKIMNGVAETI